MARDVFNMTIAVPDAVSSVMKAMSGIKVTVYKRDTTQAVTVYRRSDGTTQGPTAESGATGGPNPFITGPNGVAEFWCDGPAEIDVAIEDTQAPARIAPRTLGWNCMTAAAGSIPGSLLGGASIGLSNVAADVLRQMAQIGQVIDWWRPAASVPVPSGWVICDGTQIPAGQHDFPGLATSAINLPDLRNVFILGADPTEAQGTGANQGNAPTDAPGIGGKGGSNAAKNFAHGHGVPGVSHQHLTTTPDHLHTVGSLYAADHGHGASSGIASRYTSPYDASGPSSSSGWESKAYGNHNHGISIGGSGNLGIGGATGAADRSLAAWSGAPNVSLNTATNSLTWTADPGTDMRPQFVGLLKLMKVRLS